MVLKGARRVGKTWIMKGFGKNHCKNFVYFNFDEEDNLKSIFESNKSEIDCIIQSGTQIIPVICSEFGKCKKS